MAIVYNPSIVRDGLVLHLDAANPKSYPGSGTIWKDLSGLERNSSIVGATWNNAGYFVFDGSGERDGSPTGNYITLDTSSTTTAPSTKPNGVTYSWWMKIDEDQPAGHSLLFGSGTVNHLEWRGSSTSGSFRTEAVTQNGYSFGASAPPGGLDLNFWHNISIVFANNESGRPVRWYKNGNLFFTGSMTGGSNPSGEYFIPNSFGRATGSSSYLYVQSFLGKLSLFSIYDRSLSENEIKNIFNAMRSRYDL